LTPLDAKNNWVDQFDANDPVAEATSVLSKLNNGKTLELGEADIDEILKPRYEAKDMPKIFVYNLPKSLKENIEPSKLIQMVIIDFQNTTLSLGYAPMYAMDKLLADTLMHRRKHYVTRNPHEADLFFMPLKHDFLGRPNLDPEFVCNIHPDNQTMFEHLNSSTACRHFHASGTVDFKCRKERIFQQEIFSGVVNFMSLEYGFDVPYPAYSANSTDESLRHLMKFISKTWTNRKFLISAHFSLHGYQAAADLRIALMAECKNNSDYCQYKGHKWGDKKKQIERHLLPYFNSVFCLQPPGDSYSCKAMVDSMVGGCIPVLFVEEQLRLWRQKLQFSFLQTSIMTLFAFSEVPTCPLSKGYSMKY